MVKDQGAIRKKRKTISSENDADTDIYRKVVEFEEKEALYRSADEDAKLFIEMCTELRKLLTDAVTAKASPTTNQLVVKMCINISVMKKLNRIQQLRQVHSKEALNEGKVRVESIKLVFENLVYELVHLATEVTQCKAFKSKHEEIELIDLEQFIKQAAPSAANETNEHALTLSRLEHELAQRKSLAKECEKMHENKKVLNAAIMERKSKLDELMPLLNNVISATKPLQDHLNINFDRVTKEHKLARLLPDTLYILYTNLMAYQDVYDSKLVVEICGDAEEAQQFEDTKDELDSEPEPEVEEVKKRRHRKSTQLDALEEKKIKLFESHPLTISVTLLVKNVTLILTFRYLTKLTLVTVLSHIKFPNSITGFSAQEILTGINLLSELTPGDLGTTSPNPSTVHHLKKINVDSFRTLVPTLGHAFNWAQSNCGLEFLNKKIPEESGSPDVEQTMRNLKQRIISRLDLCKQIQKLEENLMPEVGEDLDIPQKITADLRKFTSLTYEKYSELSGTYNEDLVISTDMFFHCQVARNGANLDAFICIKNSYPMPAPMFNLKVTYNGNELKSTNSNDVRDMEKTINLDLAKVGKSPNLLALQIVYLRAQFDVYLETNFPKDFVQNTMFFKNVSGRTRRRPFKFRKIGTGIFSPY